MCRVGCLRGVLFTFFPLVDVLQLFVADVVAVAELEVVIVHAKCRTEQVSHVGGPAARKVNVIGEAQGGFLVHPLDHRAVSAHHAVHVPVGGPIVESHFAQRLDGHVESRVGLPLSVFLAGHVGRTDEQDVCVGICLLDGLDLPRNQFLGPVDVSGIRARDQVSAVLHDDEPCVHRLVGFGKELGVDAVEDGARRAAHGDIVDSDAISAISRNGVDFAVSGQIHLGNGCRVLEFPGVYLELVEGFDGRFACIHHLGGALFLRITLFVFADDFDEGLVYVELRFDASALVGQELYGAVATDVAKGVLALFLALLDGD